MSSLEERPSKRAKPSENGDDTATTTTTTTTAAATTTHQHTNGVERRIGVIGGNSVLSKTQRTELLRLMLQTLDDYGLSQTAAALRAEGKVESTSSEARDFCAAVLGGDWSKVLALLPTVAVSKTAESECAYLVHEQRCLEQQEAGAVAEALTTLQTSLTPMKIEKFAHRLFVLSGLLLATDADEVRATASRDLPLPPAATDEGVRAHRSHRHLRSRHERDRERLMYPPASLRRSDGADALSSSIGSQTPTPTVSSTTTSTTTAATMQSRRSELLAAVRSRVRTDAMLPNARLETLVQQALSSQLSRCHAHAAPTTSSGDDDDDNGVSTRQRQHGSDGDARRNVSLLCDHQCRSGEPGSQRRADDTVPVVCALVLEQHRDEVWHVAFRRDGRRLASASKDGRVLVWEVSMQSVTAAAAAAAATARAPAATESSNNNNDDDDDDDERAEHAHDDMRLTFRLLTTLEHGAPVGFVEWSRDNRRLLTLTAIGDVFVWALDDAPSAATLVATSLADTSKVRAVLNDRRSRSASSSVTATSAATRASSTTTDGSVTASVGTPLPMAAAAGGAVVGGSNAPTSAPATTTPAPIVSTTTSGGSCCFVDPTGTRLAVVMSPHLNLINFVDVVAGVRIEPLASLPTSTTAGTSSPQRASSSSPGAAVPERIAASGFITDIAAWFASPTPDASSGASRRHAQAARLVALTHSRDVCIYSVPERRVPATPSVSSALTSTLPALRWSGNASATAAAAAAASTSAMMTPPLAVIRQGVDEVASSLLLTNDGERLAALLCNTDTLHWWDLSRRRMVRAYRGKRQSRFVIRAALGGTRVGGDNETRHARAYVASGSEDAKVYIWDRESAALLATLSGHSGVVNAVAWNPVHVQLLLSASDDSTLRVWLPRGMQCVEIE